jgi:hypothetical protein
MECDDMPVGVPAPMFDDAGEREFASGGPDADSRAGRRFDGICPDEGAAEG